ncbi:MAG TPA: YqhA family protein [Methylocella sp.]|nr:YqhA family protein [Methylocella sp.]
MTDNYPVGSEPRPPAERFFERTIFASRWLLALFFLGLVVSLIVLLVKFGQKLVKLVAYSVDSAANEAIANVLSLIDLCLIASLVLIVMYSGYENFVSRFELSEEKYKPVWMGQVGFGELKLKLMTSIIAISAVHLLDSFMNVDQSSDRELEWDVGIQITLIVTGVLLALMQRISGRGQH